MRSGMLWMGRSGKKFAVFVFLILASLLAACSVRGTPLPLPPLEERATPTRVYSCQDLDAPWNAGDWPHVLAALDALRAAHTSCGDVSLASKQYAAHINYAAALEQQSKISDAVREYRAALALDGRRQEALRALQRLNALPAPTPAPCAPEPLRAYTPTKTDTPFARVQGNKIFFDDARFRVRGVNYYPRNAPWQDFLGASDLDEIAREFDLIAARGFNTLRIFLWYDALFQCAPERAIPDARAFEKLDALFALAAARDLRVIVTLNDLPDFYFRPIYADWARYDAQTEFIVQRYRDEPLILAWDVRNEGDIDYGVTGASMPNATRAQVLAWLEHVTHLARAHDPNHLLTAGWLDAGLETAPYVDVLSLHHWSSENGLAEKIADLARASGKPVWVEEMGLAALGRQGERAQVQVLPRMIETAEASDSAGWLLWTAFDFYALPDDLASPEHRFGIWRNDLAPKPVVDALPLPTRQP